MLSYLTFEALRKESSATVRRILTALEKPVTKAYLMFLCDTLPAINIFNKVMQNNSPTIHYLHSEVVSFMKKLVLCFMIPRAIQNASCLDEIDINDTSFHIKIGLNFLLEKRQDNFLMDDDNDMFIDEMKHFREKCKEFWIEVTLRKKLPLNDDFLTNLGGLNFLPKTVSSLSSW